MSATSICPPLCVISSPQQAGLIAKLSDSSAEMQRPLVTRGQVPGTISRDAADPRPTGAARAFPRDTPGACCFDGLLELNRSWGFFFMVISKTVR